MGLPYGMQSVHALHVCIHLLSSHLLRISPKPYFTVMNSCKYGNSLLGFGVGILLSFEMILKAVQCEDSEENTHPSPSFNLHWQP